MVVLREVDTAEGGTNIDGDAQGGGRNGRTRDGSTELGKGPGQVAVPAESRADINANGFWKWGTIAMFDIRISNLDTGSYLHMTPKKALVKTERGKKYLYLQYFLDSRCYFTPVVYSANKIPEVEALAAQRRLAALLSFNLKLEYTELCGFVRERMSLEVVGYNILLLFGPQDKLLQVHQQLDLTYGAVMALLAPWRG